MQSRLSQHSTGGLLLSQIICIILLIYFEILCTHVRLRLGDIKEERRMKDKCAEKKGRESRTKTEMVWLVRLNGFQSDICQYENGSLWIPLSIRRYWRTFEYLCSVTLLFMNFVNNCTLLAVLERYRHSSYTGHH